MWLHSFRAFPPGAEFRLNPNINVFLGVNGSGKTSALEALRFALGGALDPSEEADVEVELVSNESSVEPMRMRRTSELRRSEGRPPRRAEKIRFEIPTASLKLSISPDSSASATINDAEAYSLGPVSSHAPLVDALETLLDNDLSVQQTEMVKGAIRALKEIPRDIQRYDEHLGRFQRFTSPDDLLLSWGEQAQISLQVSGGHTPLRVRHLLFEHLAKVESEPHRQPNPFYQITFGQQTEDSEARDYASIFCEQAGFESLQCAFSMSGVELDTKTKTGEYTYKLTLSAKDGSGNIFPLERLSFGQRRLLSILEYLEAHRGIAILDEPTNGLHYSWIEAILSELQGRQSILAVQNPLILDFLSFDSAKDISDTFTCFRLERPHTTCEGLSDERGEELYSAYRAGFAHVSNILRMFEVW